MKRFFKKDMYIPNESIAENELNFFRYSLLSTLTFTAFIFAFFVAMLYVLEFFPSNKLYQNILFLYSFINLVSYYLLQMYRYRYYLFSVNIMILSSLATFTVMALTATYDEFRFVWFFLASFASFILAGKRYGFMTSFMIVSIMMSLYLIEQIELSAYGMFTFITALFVLNIFSYLFLQKIENDSNLLQNKVIEEVTKRQTQEQLLLRQYRMTNMGEMIDAIAHQWRQPLMQTNMILLNLDDSLDDETYTKDSVQDKIKELTDLTAHMSQTIEDFRYLLQSDKDKKIFQIQDTLEEVLGLMKNHLRDIDITCNDIDVSIINYKNELVQVLIILLSNAVEAFDAKRVEYKRIDIAIQSIEDHLIIEIEDSAGGLEGQYINKLFDPYFTTKKQSGGTGLGLYIAKIIIEQNMNGKLTVANGRSGAKFTIKVKRDMKQVKQILSTYSVLYAEDDHGIQRSVVEYLSKYFQNVYVANDGDEALGLYETVKPDALILDIDMPYIDGLSVAKNIRETNQNIPIVILTAFTDTDKLLYATELNLCKYLVKPVVPHDFKEALKKISLLLYALSSQYIFLSPTHTWDRQGKQLLHQGAPVKITQKEQMLLDLFISKRNQCIAFVEIMAVVWEDDIDSDVSIESVKLQVHYLRKKLPKNMIHNIYGKGYALRVAEV